MMGEKQRTNILNSGRMIVIDLYSGSYNDAKIGHELFNLDRNPIDGNFYGYCPPLDRINIRELGASHRDEYIDGILVVYVSKKKNSINREIQAFCLNARVFKTGQAGDELSRNFIDKDGKAEASTYSIKSKELFDLRNRFNKFEINISDYSTYMFRSQRFYGGTYPQLDREIIAYIKSVLGNKEILDNDDSDEQEEIQRSEPATLKEIQSSADKELNIIQSYQGDEIAKNSRISKSALIEAKYICAVDQLHITFITPNKTPYMEGHHLIPCTVANSKCFMENSNKNIDCLENIVCLCPNCHREVHYGDWDSKSMKIKELYNKQKDKLEKVGLLISEEELLNLYK